MLQHESPLGENLIHIAVAVVRRSRLSCESETVNFLKQLIGSTCWRIIIMFENPDMQTSGTEQLPDFVPQNFDELSDHGDGGQEFEIPHEFLLGQQ